MLLTHHPHGRVQLNCFPTQGYMGMWPSVKLSSHPCGQGSRTSVQGPVPVGRDSSDFSGLHLAYHNNNKNRLRSFNLSRHVPLAVGLEVGRGHSGSNTGLGAGNSPPSQTSVSHSFSSKVQGQAFQLMPEAQRPEICVRLKSGGHWPT